MHGSQNLYDTRYKSILRKDAITLTEARKLKRSRNIHHGNWPLIANQSNSRRLQVLNAASAPFVIYLRGEKRP